MQWTLIVCILGAAALAAGQGVPTIDNCMPRTMSEEKCLAFCSCVYCLPADSDSDGAAGPQGAAPEGAGGPTGALAGRASRPVVGCIDWTLRDRCVGNYTTRHGTCDLGSGAYLTLAIIGVVLIGIAVALIACRLCADCAGRCPTPLRKARGLGSYDEL